MHSPRKERSALIQEQTVFIYCFIVILESPLLTALFEMIQ